MRARGSEMKRLAQSFFFVCFFWPVFTLILSLRFRSSPTRPHPFFSIQSALAQKTSTAAGGWGKKSESENLTLRWWFYENEKKKGWCGRMLLLPLLMLCIEKWKEGKTKIFILALAIPHLFMAKHFQFSFFLCFVLVYVRTVCKLANCLNIFTRLTLHISMDIKKKYIFCVCVWKCVHV